MTFYRNIALVGEVGRVTGQQEIPCEFFRESWEDVDHPMCCVSLEHRFVKCNSVWERLLGYSSEELRQHTWMSITRAEHVGGDLASVQAVMEGRQTEYRMEKDYIHKKGHYVPVVLIVRRYPRQSTEPLLYFRVEAPMAIATRPELDDIASRTTEMLAKFHDELTMIKERGVSVHVGDKWRDGDKAGRDLEKNSDRTIKYLIGGLVAMAIVVAWLFYYVAVAGGGGTPVPPPAPVSTGAGS